MPKPVGKSVVLVVDDDELVRECLQDQLARFFDVLVAAGGKEGLLLLEAHTVDVIISDQVMPEMTGDQFLKLAAEKWPEVSRILLTGFADLSSVVKAVNYGGIFHYMSKPWSMAEMISVIRKGAQITHDARAQRTLSAERDQALNALQEGRQFLNDFVMAQGKPHTAESAHPPHNILLRPREGRSLPAIVECLDD